ncbi:MAG: hypothetical protein IJ530_10470 [Treponema sp.]|uniref:hypothetical protein n=1 Tax=Treponema sp. TaxID=166 RepID=UPI0025EAD8E9|nr:hypothetical protein [Treponema sp.]MBQ8680170.1 hypothetical protein [Treponema sp.]MBR1404953.1 hypothetical protein [Treponema sp.]
MSKKIYALKVTKHEANGTVLRDLYNILLKSYKVLESYPGTSSLGNVTAILEIREGQNIGIETQGGNHSRLPDSLKNFVSKNCDTIFCSCLSSGKTVTEIEKLKPTYEVIFCEKQTADALWRMAKE